jgi:arsenite-transporting ATPase
MSRTPSSPTVNQRFVFFAGKGGVGKSTCAAAAALLLARSQDVLALSLDPAHSLRDVLAGTGPEVLELDARQEFGGFMREHREELRTIADRGTYFDDEDIAGFLDLSLPGLDEIMALLKLSELAGGPRGRRVVVDLPPTGHALRLFDVAAAFDHVVEALELMQDKHRFAVSSLTRRYTRDAMDDFLRDLRASCQAARDALLQPEESAFILVARPEHMVLAETGRLADRLRAIGAAPAALVLNAVDASVTAVAVSPGGGAGVAELCDLPRIEVPWLADVPVGGEGLRPVAGALGPLFGIPAKRPRRSARAHSRAASASGNVRPLLRDARRLTIFGGKGGVGKTTMAAATALALAAAEPERSVVVLSIDPAHSLGDSLGQALGDEPRPVPEQPNLRAAELDPVQHWREFKEHWDAEGAQLFGGLPGSGRLDPVYDRQIAAQLGEIQPSGLDELQAALSVIDLLDEDPARLVVVDSAPTGHLLRFLESPRLVVDWAKELMRILLKYGLASQLKRLSEDLLDLSRKTKRLEALLHDPTLCEVVVVTVGEGPVLAETARLIQRLGEMDVQVRRMVVNFAGEKAQAGTIEREFPNLEIVPLGRRSVPVQGLSALRELAA